jgi:O-6-methylguanine DNA methyltransferase
MKYQLHKTPIGPLIITAIDNKIRHIYFEDSVDLTRLQAREGQLERDDYSDVLNLADKQLTAYFLGKHVKFSLPLVARGTTFQQSVWRGLEQIPYGKTCSYADLASSLSKPTATRAVGAANGKNPISIIIPCHRVIGKDGSLTGYAGSVERKSWLLNHEQINSRH